MSKALITESHLTDIANAIIAKGGATAPMTPAQMAAAIAVIPSGGGFSLPVPASSYYEQSMTHFYDIWENGGDGIHVENPSTICDLVGQLDMTVLDCGVCTGSSICKIKNSDFAAVADDSGLDTSGDRSAEITVFGSYNNTQYDIFVAVGKGGIIGFHGSGSQFVFNAAKSFRWNCEKSITEKKVHTLTANFRNNLCVSAFVDGSQCEITSTSTTFSTVSGFGFLPYQSLSNCSSLRLYSGHRTLQQHNANHELDIRRFENE